MRASAVTGGVPTTWDDLNTKAQTALSSLGGDTKQWCIGVKSDPGSEGWPGTDWIEDFVLRQSGPDVYDAWVKGTQKWSSPEIKMAWQEFGKAVDNALGGPTNVASADFRQAGDPAPLPFACSLSLPFGDPLYGALTSAPEKERIRLSGGASGDCGGYHLFMGIDAEFVAAVSAFIDKHNPTRR